MWLENRKVKVFLVYILPLLIGGLFSAMGSWDYKSDKWFWGKAVVLFILIVIYVITTAQYVKREKEKENKIKLLEEKVQEKDEIIMVSETYHMVFDSINNLMNVSQKDLNDLSKQIVSSNNLDLITWNFQSISSCICKDVVSILKKVAKTGSDISVSVYVRFKRKSGRRTQDCIKMIAYSGGTNSDPSILYSDIILTRKKDWQYARLFLANNPKIVVYSTEEEIKKNFAYKGNPSKYDGEYTQYIGIPISCSEGNILSAMEIIAHHGTIIADTKDEILELMNKYIIVYRNYALLAHKIEKGLRAKRVENEKEGDK